MAFGAGLSSACVVDIGDEKTNICCVEDGISNPSTRLTLHVGGSDITRLFYDLLLEVSLPIKVRIGNLFHLLHYQLVQVSIS